MEAIAIHDGINLHVIPSQKFTTNTLCVLIRRPLTRKEATPNALLPSVLTQGCALYPSITDINLAAERMYGSLFEGQIIKKGEQHIMQFYFECADHDPALLSDGLAFLREIILRPLTDGDGFKSAFFRRETTNLKKRIEARINNKRDYAKLKCVETMCENEPFGLYGDGYLEDLPAITPSGLLHYYKKTVATSPMDFIAIGKWDQARLKEQIAEFFNPYREPIMEIPKAETKPARSERAVIKPDTGSTQGNLCIGLRGEIEPVGESYIHFQLANEILGGGPNAKLFIHVREKESLCYYINSFIYRFKSMLCIQAGVAADQFERVLELTEGQIDVLKRGEISDNELENAKRSLTKRWLSLQDYPSGSLDFYASQYLLNDDETIDQMTERVWAASRDGVVEAAGQLSVDTVVMAR